MTLSRKNIIKIAVVLAGLILAVVIARTTPPQPLTEKSMIGLGIFVFFVLCSMVEAFPDYICWLLMCTGWAAFKCVPFNKAFGFFTSTSWWLVVGAMVLAAAVAKTGLLKRIALTVMTKFPVSYKWQTASLMITGLVVTPFIPSGTVKASLMAPFALSISDSLGFERRSKGATGLFLSMWMSIGLLIPTMISASFINYVILGTLPEEMKVSYGMWLLASLPWIIITLVVGYIIIHTVYKVPTGAVTATNEALMQEKRSLPPMSRDEKITTFVLIFCLTLWVLERVLGVNSTITILIGVAILASTGVIDRTSFRSKVTWDAIIFLGCALSMTTAFPAMNIDKWLGGLAGPVVVPLISENIVLFIVVLSAVIYVIRIFMTSQTAMIALFMVFLVPAAMAAGVHPWIMGFIAFTAANCFIFKYQNVMYMPAIFAAQTAAGEDFVEHKNVAVYGVMYMILNIAVLIVCVPFWKLLGWL